MIFSGGITGAKGYLAWGEHVGLKRQRKDMAVVVSEVPATVAAVFTTNKAKAAPVEWNQNVLAGGGSVKAILVNSGQANSCTGMQGKLNASLMAHKLAEELQCNAAEVMLASTGVIGPQIPMSAALSGIKSVAAGVRADQFAGSSAAEAIITTDSCTKECASSIVVGGKEVTIGAMAKGSGMIHPMMATMLSFIATDLSIAPELLQKALKASVDATYNMISVDGDTSTNDMVILLANGLAHNETITEENEDFQNFCVALTAVNQHLAKKIAADANGATKRIAVTVSGGSSIEQARAIARKVAASNLVKSSMHKCEAHWGRVIAAIGSADVPVDISSLSITFASELGQSVAFENGCEAVNFAPELAHSILQSNEVEIKIALMSGESNATAWGCDMDYDSIRARSTVKQDLEKILAEVG
jgi:glutamate N-acetyltransferase/amino-acid N-acetyltransferase